MFLPVILGILQVNKVFINNYLFFISPRPDWNVWWGEGRVRWGRGFLGILSPLQTSLYSSDEKAGTRALSSRRHFLVLFDKGAIFDLCLIRRHL